MSALVAANDNHDDFYVYAWLRPNGQPFYIGKGRGGRDRATKANNPIFKRIVAKMARTGEDPVVIRLHDDLSERAAFELECAEIAKYGRLNNRTGILANLTDGGEGTSGWIPSEETKAKISAAHTGKVLSASHRAKLLEIATNPSAETRAKMSASQTGRKHKSSTLALMSENNAMHRPEMRAKVSSALTGRVFTEEHRLAISISASNKTDEQRAAISISNRMRGPSSGYKGVSFNKKTGKWKVAIRIGKDRPFLGYFSSPEAAAKVYDRAAIGAWGLGNCYINFPIAANDNAQLSLQLSS